MAGFCNLAGGLLTSNVAKSGPNCRKSRDATANIPVSGRLTPENEFDRHRVARVRVELVPSRLSLGAGWEFLKRSIGGSVCCALSTALPRYGARRMHQ
jgi:hypothetical protein